MWSNIRVMTTSHSVLTLQPILTETADGSWLAVTSADAPVRVGALEPTEDAARIGFTKALRRMADALERGEHDGQDEQ